ncbi:exodeoxyribonuclease VII small subunit [Angustibacter aerolatus]
MPRATPKTDPLADLSYEQARDELLDVVRRLEAGGTSLEDSLALWERGEALAARCQTWLDGARERLDAAHGSQPALLDDEDDLGDADDDTAEDDEDDEDDDDPASDET